MFYDPFEVLFSSTKPLQPKMDVVESEVEFKVVMDVPGLSKEQINIELDKDLLTISGQYPKSADDYKYHIRERLGGSFKRQLKLGNIYDAKDVKAECRDGTLVLLIRKRNEDLVKKIDIS